MQKIFRKAFIVLFLLVLGTAYGFVDPTTLTYYADSQGCAGESLCIKHNQAVYTNGELDPKIRSYVEITDQTSLKQTFDLSLFFSSDVEILQMMEWKEKTVMVDTVENQEVTEYFAIDANHTTCEARGLEYHSPVTCKKTSYVGVTVGQHEETRYFWKKTAGQDIKQWSQVYGDVPGDFVAEGGKQLTIGKNEKKYLFFDWIPIEPEGKYWVQAEQDGIILGDDDPAWLNSSWVYRQMITLRTSDVMEVSSDKDVAVLVDTNSSNSMWANTQANGEDIRFTAADGTTLLSYHFEDFNHGTDTMIAWVQIHEDFSADYDMNIYMYYGNGGAADAQDEPGTYDGNHTSVYHVDDNPADQLTDSTSNAQTGVKVGDPAAQQASCVIGDCIDFDSVDDSFILPFNMDANTEATVMFWVETDDSGLGENTVFGVSTADNASQWLIHLPADNGGINDLVYIHKKAGDAGGVTENDSLSNSTWYHIAITTGAGYTTLIRDGVVRGFDDGTEVPTVGEQYVIGARRKSGASDRFHDGDMDEIWFLTEQLDTNIIKVIYENQKSPEDFLRFGAEETDAPADSALIDVNINPTLDGTTISGTETISFNLSSSESEVHLKIFVSTAQAGYTCSVEADLNINDYANVAGLNCADSNFENSTNCTYSWDSWESLSCINDGATYIDLNAWNYSGTYGEDVNASGAMTFDNEPVRDGNWSYSIGGILDVENGTTTVPITLTDISNRHLMTNVSFEWDRNGAVISVDQNKVHNDGNFGDLNICFYVVQSYDYNADSWEDGNCMVAHVRTYPQDVNFVWSPTNPGTSQLVDFNGDANGSGIVIWNFGFVSPDANKYSQDTNHTFNDSGQKTVCLTVQNIDDLNRTTCYDLNIYGSIRVRFKDERTGADVNAWARFNDTNTLTTGLFSQSLAAFSETSAEYSFMAWDINRQRRTILLDLNRFSSIDINMLLLNTTEGRSVEFQFYAPDALTLLPGARVTVRLDANYIEGATLDASAETTFFLDTNNAAYVFYIDAADGNSYVYNAVLVTVRIPLQEDDLTNQITPFEVDIGGLARAYYGNQTTDSNFYILGNTLQYYEIQAGDWNASDYYDRYYFVSISGSAATYELQPYLVSVTNGLVSELYAVDSMDNPVPQALFVIQKQLTGVTPETIEIVQTDDTGRGIVSWVTNDTYYISVYYQNSFQGEVLVRPSLSRYDILVITDNPAISVPTGEIVLMEYNSTSLARLETDDLNRYHFDINFQSPTGSIQSITMSLICNGVTKYTETQNTNVANGASFLVDINASDFAGCDIVTAQFDITTPSGTTTKIVIYGLAEALVRPFNTLKDTLGETVVLLIAVFISGIAVAVVAFKFSPNPIASGIVGGAVLAFFTAVGWVSWPVFAFACFIGAIISFLYFKEVF